MFYYGRRTAKNCHPSDLFVTYFTSSEYVSQYIKTNGTPDVIDIRKIFTSTEKCMQWEERVLRKIDAPCNLKFLNKSYGDGKFSSTGMCLVRNLNGISEYTSVDDPRFLTGEIVGRAKGVKYSDEINSKKAVGRGKVAVKDCFGNNYLVPLNDPRYISGELIPLAKGVSHENYNKENWGKHMKGCVIARDSNWNWSVVNQTDPRYMSGELIAIGTGMPMAKDASGKIFRTTKNDPRWETGEIWNPAKGKSVGKGIPKPKTECIYCGRNIANNMLNRYHNENCKLKPK